MCHVHSLFTADKLRFSLYIRLPLGGHLPPGRLILVYGGRLNGRFSEIGKGKSLASSPLAGRSIVNYVSYMDG